MGGSSRSIALKAVAGAAVFGLSFWLSLRVMEYFQSPWEPIGSNAVVAVGDASASAPSLADDTAFQFLGDGYIEIQNTKSFQCVNIGCRLSLTVAFGPVPAASTQLIVGQSFLGEKGWHLLLADGRLLLQRDGGTIQIAAPFAPRAGQYYKFDIVHDQRGVTLSVDGVVVAEGNQLPFTDLARDLTIGGRAGPIRLPLTGAVTHVEIATQRSGQ